MPLSSNEQTVKTGQALVDQFHGIFGAHAGFRPAHAKGILLKGTFTPSTTASSLSKAPHFNTPTTPITVRFSNSTGLPHIPDATPDANPRGIAIRFHLADTPKRVHTDVIAHSTNGFPTRTGEEFLGFLQAAASSGPDVPSPKPIEKFLGAHPSALAFVQTPKPTPASFASATYFGVNAFKLVDADGKGTFIRYKIVPEYHADPLDEAALKEKDADFLQEELKKRLSSGPVKFSLGAQVAVEGDVTDDATVHWPESREVAILGTVEIDTVVPTEEAAQEMKKTIFDPIPRVEGVEASADPLLEMRAAVYLISGRERRAASALEA